MLTNTFRSRKRYLVSMAKARTQPAIHKQRSRVKLQKASRKHAVLLGRSILLFYLAIACFKKSTKKTLATKISPAILVRFQILMR